MYTLLCHFLSVLVIDVLVFCGFMFTSDDDAVSLDFLLRYLAISIYHHQLYRWLQYFPIEQFLFLSFEDMENNAEGVQKNIDRITDHIGVPRVDIHKEDGSVTISNTNSKGKHEKPSIQVLRGLKNFFQPHNQRFYEMTGLDFGWEKQVDDLIRKQMAESRASSSSSSYPTRGGTNGRKTSSSSSSSASASASSRGSRGAAVRVHTFPRVLGDIFLVAHSCTCWTFAHLPRM